MNPELVSDLSAARFHIGCSAVNLVCSSTNDNTVSTTRWRSGCCGGTSASAFAANSAQLDTSDAI